jgi:hypothetical protein
MNFSNLRKLALPALLLGTLVLTGCAGARLGPGTTTGAVIGGAASILNGDGGRAAAIGVGVGAAVDILNGEPPIEVETYRDGRYYRDDPYYRGPVYRDPPRVFRPAPPPPPRRHQPRRFYDERCGCFYYR